MHLYDLTGNKVTVLSIMDIGSGYHIVAPVAGRKALHQGFLELLGGLGRSSTKHNWSTRRGDLRRTSRRSWRSMGSKSTILPDKLTGRVATSKDNMNGSARSSTESRSTPQCRTMRHHGYWQLLDKPRIPGYFSAQWLFGVAPRLGLGSIDDEEDTTIHDTLTGPMESKERDLSSCPSPCPQCVCLHRVVSPRDGGVHDSGILELVQAVEVPHRGEEVDLCGIVQSHLVDIPPGKACVGQRASHFFHSAYTCRSNSWLKSRMSWFAPLLSTLKKSGM